MGSVIGEVLPVAVAVAVSPVPVIAVILMLFTPEARTNSVAFLLGWLLGLIVVGSIVLIAGDVASDDSGESTVSGVVKLVFGLLFLVLAVRSWRSRPKAGEDPEMPGWMAAIDGFGAVKSAGIAALLSGLNPKNLALTVAAAATIAAAGLTTGEEIGAFAIFVTIASITVAAPVLVYLIMGDRVQGGLNSLKEWLIANNNTVMAVLLVVLGAKLLGDGISILSN
ncbi:MAG: GAP family protein [Chloroflexi bacterium]|nr:GAP family protein [Chloroflexota bacterium]